MAKSTWGRAQFRVKTDETASVVITVTGRERRALEFLIAAGPTGCNPIEHPGPRWSGYVFDLRAMGLRIDTDHEGHRGDFPGHHARYRLVTRLTRLGRVAA